MSNLNIKYLGHSAFFIKPSNGGGILIDPFISQNPLANFDYTKENITHIFVTHGHSDHLGDAISISQNTGATIITIFELANYCMERGAKAFGVNLGGKLNFDFGWATFCPAFHSSSTPDGNYAGCPAGIVFNFQGTTVYHTGDTCLTQEFKTVKEIFAPDIVMLPIGGVFTMDVEQAVIGAKWIGAKYVIPMHYNTFPPIKANTNQFKTLLEQNNQEPVILDINQEFEM